MTTRFPIRSMVTCPVCGARRRIDMKRVRVFAAPTAIAAGRSEDIVVPAGVHICASHQTAAEFAADEARRHAHGAP